MNTKPHCDICGAETSDLVDFLCPACREMHSDETWNEDYLEAASISSDNKLCIDCGAEKQEAMSNYCDECSKKHMDRAIKFHSENPQDAYIGARRVTLDNLSEMAAGIAADKTPDARKAAQDVLFQVMMLNQFAGAIMFWQETLNGQCQNKELQAILEQIAAYVDPVSHAEQQAADFIENLWPADSDDNESDS